MSPVLRLIVALILGTGVCLSMLGCAGCRGKSTPATDTGQEKPGVLPPAMPDTFQGDVTGGARFSIPLSGKRSWTAEVKSIHVEVARERQVLVLKEIDCRLYEAGQESLRVCGDAGTITRHGEVMRADLRGHIRAIGARNQYRLQAAAFNWVSTENVIHVSRFAWTGDNVTARADSGIVTTDLSSLDTTSATRIEILEPARRR